MIDSTENPTALSFSMWGRAERQRISLYINTKENQTATDFFVLFLDSEEDRMEIVNSLNYIVTGRDRGIVDFLLFFWWRRRQESVKIVDFL